MAVALRALTLLTVFSLEACAACVAQDLMAKIVGPKEAGLRSPL